MSALFHSYLCGRIAAEWLIAMKEVKVGIVGLGRLGSVHAENLTFKIPGCKLVAACSLVEKELEWAKDSLKVEFVTTDYK